jgi:hypothetical protein
MYGPEKVGAAKTAVLANSGIRVDSLNNMILEGWYA